MEIPVYSLQYLREFVPEAILLDVNEIAKTIDMQAASYTLMELSEIRSMIARRLVELIKRT